MYDIKGTPEKATQTDGGVSPIEENDFTLSCDARSTSHPEEYQDKVTMEYIWQKGGEALESDDDHDISGNTLAIMRLSRGDTGSIYTCQGREEGSPLTSPVSDGYELTVHCKYMYIVN